MDTIIDVLSYQSSSSQIVADVFETMIGYHVDPCPEVYAPDARMVTAAVFFAGNWRGATLLECSQAQACVFAGRLMGIPRPESMNDDVRDALGEFVNMIGGNLKSVLPPGVALSMPSVLDGSDYAYKICGDNLKDRLSFRGDLGPLWVTLVQLVTS
jgi:CheY-specific phosphatase CheX